jgi:hypothetical protein
MGTRCRPPVVLVSQRIQRFRAILWPARWIGRQNVEETELCGGNLTQSGCGRQKDEGDAQ